MTRTQMNQLKTEQLKLAKKVITTNQFSDIKLVAGTDQTVVNKHIIAVISVLTYPKLEEVEKKYAIIEQQVPYTPGYMFYHEGLAIMEAYNKLEKKPDILMVKGDGILHPRRIGIASHLGLVLDIPTIGILKTLLCGELKNDTAYVGNEARGKLLVTKKTGNPIFVSPGHKCTLETAFEITKKCVVPPHKMPEPIATSHKLIIKLRKFQRDKQEPTE